MLFKTPDITDRCSIFIFPTGHFFSTCLFPIRNRRQIQILPEGITSMFFFQHCLNYLCYFILFWSEIDHEVKTLKMEDGNLQSISGPN